MATDGFLLPNAVLEARGILHRKGYPESYDAPAVEQFLDDMRAGSAEVTVPVYSHVSYDIVVGERLPVAHPDVLVLEGVNVLQFADRLDIGVYLQAPEAAMEAWYVGPVPRAVRGPATRVVLRGLRGSRRRCSPRGSRETSGAA